MSPGIDNSQTLLFAIPAGFIVSSALYTASYVASGVNPLTGQNIEWGNPATLGVGNGTRTNVTTALSALGIAQINAAAGGNFSADFTTPSAFGTITLSSLTLTLTGSYPPGSASISTKKDYSRHTRHVHQFLTIAFTGYKPEINVNDYGGLVTVFASVKVPGWNRARLVNDVLQIYDSAGNELADGADCPSPVSIWRIGF